MLGVSSAKTVRRKDFYEHGKHKRNESFVSSVISVFRKKSLFDEKREADKSVSLIFFYNTTVINVNSMNLPNTKEKIFSWIFFKILF